MRWCRYTLALNEYHDWSGPIPPAPDVLSVSIQSIPPSSELEVGFQPTPSARSRQLRLFLPDGVPGASSIHDLIHKQMDSLRYGFTNPLRDAVKLIRILVNDQREYLVGIILLLVVVFLWALSNFVTQVRGFNFGPVDYP